jgi:hypothetical protein
MHGDQRTVSNLPRIVGKKNRKKGAACGSDSAPMVNGNFAQPSALQIVNRAASATGHAAP